MSKKEPVILPEKYYLDYFNYVLEFVEKRYEHILDQPEYLFFQAFRNLSEQAQCLYLRFSNRRGDFFRLSRINYSEITDLKSAKEELEHQGFIQINDSLDTYQFSLFTKKELLALYDFLHHAQRKYEILGELSESDLSVIHNEEEIAQVLKNEEVNFIKLLFFGNNHGQMTDFVVRDVGNVKIEKLDESKFSPWFESRDEAIGVMHISQLKQMIREVQKAELPLEEFIEDIPWNVWLSYPRSAESAEKLLLELAYYFERNQKNTEALNLYEYTNKPPARERKIRILDRLDRKDEALDIANAILTAPKNASELTFAHDFLNRKGIRIDRSMTQRLKNAPSIEITSSEENVEKEVLAYFHDQGWQGVHAENFLWRGLFGLVFWEIIFSTDHGSFHHPLQRQPSDLNDHNFFQSRQKILTKQLDQFKNRKQLKKYIENVHSDKYLIANRFVSWHEHLMHFLNEMIDRIPLKSLKEVLIEISKNMKDNSTGFPDIFIWKDKDYHFYEVKSPNDHLSAQQLFWINFLSSAKIKVDVLRVNYV